MKLRKKSKKLLALALALSMCMSLLNLPVLAVYSDDVKSEAIQIYVCSKEEHKHTDACCTRVCGFEDQTDDPSATDDGNTDSSGSDQTETGTKHFASQTPVVTLSADMNGTVAPVPEESGSGEGSPKATESDPTDAENSGSPATAETDAPDDAVTPCGSGRN